MSPSVQYRKCLRTNCTEDFVNPKDNLGERECSLFLLGFKPWIFRLESVSLSTEIQ